MITLSRPINEQGKRAAQLLRQNNIPFMVILGEEDEELVLSDPETVYPWKGLRGIQAFIASHRSIS